MILGVVECPKFRIRKETYIFPEELRKMEQLPLAIDLINILLQAAQFDPLSPLGAGIALQIRSHAWFSG